MTALWMIWRLYLYGGAAFPCSPLETCHLLPFSSPCCCHHRRCHRQDVQKRKKEKKKKKKKKKKQEQKKEQKEKGKKRKKPRESRTVPLAVSSDVAGNPPRPRTRHRATIA